MVFQRTYPFRRISVDNIVRGNTRVWWQLEPDFHDAGPYVFQIETSNTGLPEADDWQEVGAPVTNAVYAIDPLPRVTGTVLTTHYRVTLTTPTGNYVSAPASCLGELSEAEWLKGREIVRKEELRNRKVSVGGYLIKALRYGKPCPRCRDKMTQEAGDSTCPVCFGTGYENGYHPALPLQCWDISPQVIQEGQDIELKGPTRENAFITARVIGFPGLNYKDIWVNGSSDERWLVQEIKVAAAIRGVPLVYQVTMGLLAFSNVGYSLPLSGTIAVPPTLPIAGTGCVLVTDEYLGGAGSTDLRYKTAAGTPINGASVYVFEKATYDSASSVYPPRHYAVAGTLTGTNGQWLSQLQLDPGNYVLLYEKLDEFGPDIKALAIAPIAGHEEPAKIPTTTTKRVVNTFWDI